MDDDDESQLSPATASPASASPPSNGRITVTVASQGQPTPESALTLALAAPKPRSTGGGNGREDCWSEGATAVLIDAWGERYLELSRGNLKQQHWKEVSEIVNSREGHDKLPKTDVQCKNRIDTVKKKYKAEKAKAAAFGPSRWAFYKRLDQLIGPKSAKMAAVGGAPPHPRKITPPVPSGVRSAQYHQRPHNPQPPPKPKLQPFGVRRRRPADSDSSRSDPRDSPDSTDSFGPVGRRKSPKLLRETAKFEPAARRGGSELDGELTRAILKFGQVYEQAETSKMQMVMDMEKKRMKFAKEMELQRMQFFMKMQVELLQLKHGRRGEINNNNNHHHHRRPPQHHRPHRNNNHSDSSN